MNKKRFFLFFVPFLLLSASCEKEPGEGGNSSIIGYVHVTQYDQSYTFIEGTYAGADMDVYIIYGNDITYGNRLKTGPDGKFEFKYLQKGDYKVYTYSDTLGVPDKKAIIKSVSITGRKQIINCDTLHITKI